MQQYYLVRRRDLALHYLQQAVQYILLNGDKLKIESIWELLRPAATAAGPNTNLYAEIIETINTMKTDSAKRNLTAYKAWIMVSCLASREEGYRGVSTIMTNFMVNMHRIGKYTSNIELNC